MSGMGKTGSRGREDEDDKVLATLAWNRPGNTVPDMHREGVAPSGADG